MLADLVRTTTTDGLRLDGALHEPATRAGVTPPGCDVLVCLHGVGGNFYSGTLFEDLLPRFLDKGIAVLRVNTRGHDGFYAAASLRNQRRFGAAYETVDECRFDVAAWLTFLQEQGYKRLGVLGHSLGAVKALYSQALEPHSAVTRIILASPPRLCCSAFLAGPERGTFQPLLETAEGHIATGNSETLMDVRFPSPMTISARSYIDKYGREERYDLTKFAPRLAVPSLFVYGEQELQSGGTPFRGMPEMLRGLEYGRMRPEVAVVGGADHMYTGRRRELGAEIEQWLGAQQ